MYNNKEDIKNLLVKHIEEGYKYLSEEEMLGVLGKIASIEDEKELEKKVMSEGGKCTGLTEGLIYNRNKSKDFIDFLFKSHMVGARNIQEIIKAESFSIDIAIINWENMYDGECLRLIEKIDGPMVDELFNGVKESRINIKKEFAKKLEGEEEILKLVNKNPKNTDISECIRSNKSATKRIYKEMILKKCEAFRKVKTKKKSAQATKQVNSRISSSEAKELSEIYELIYTMFSACESKEERTNYFKAIKKSVLELPICKNNIEFGFSRDPRAILIDSEKTTYGYYQDNKKEIIDYNNIDLMSEGDILPICSSLSIDLAFTLVKNASDRRLPSLAICELYKNIQRIINVSDNYHARGLMVELKKLQANLNDMEKALLSV